MLLVQDALRDSAKVWFNTLSKSYREEWSKFKLKFIKTFPLKVDLNTLRQGPNETVVSFYSRIGQHVNHLEALLPQAAGTATDSLLPAEMRGLAGWDDLDANSIAAFADATMAGGATHAFNEIYLNLFLTNLKDSIRFQVMVKMALTMKPFTLNGTFKAAKEIEDLQTPV